MKQWKMKHLMKALEHRHPGYTVTELFIWSDGSVEHIEHFDKKMAIAVRGAVQVDPSQLG